MRWSAIVIICALCLLTACGSGGAPASAPAISPTERAAAAARQTEVMQRVTATAESRAATATAQAQPTPTGTAAPRLTPTPRPPTPTPPAAAAKIFDFPMQVYQGQASLGGDEVRFSSAFAHDLPVVVNFWAPLCGPCRTEMPAFQRVADDYAGRVFFLGVDVSPYWPDFGTRDDARALLRETDVRYPTAYATESPLQPYRLLNLPATYFFAPDGTAIDRVTITMTEQQLRQAVEKLLAKSGAATSLPASTATRGMDRAASAFAGSGLNSCAAHVSFALPRSGPSRPQETLANRQRRTAGDVLDPLRYA